MLAWQVVLVPVFVVLWFSTSRYAPAAAALVFIAAAITDWLDGYLARLVSMRVAAPLFAPAFP